MTLISREREMCFGNSEREREDGKTAMKEKGKECTKEGPETIKSDFQSSVNVYDFQRANYTGQKARGGTRRTLSCD